MTLPGPFTVSDDKVTASCPVTPSLPPRAWITCTASHTITAADVTAGSITNIAWASNGTVTSATDTETVVATPTTPIQTIAGSGGTGFCGDGGWATAACVAYPYGVAPGPGGTLFIVTVNDNRVRKVSANGKISTVAGNGTAGYCGDGGPAPSACLNKPDGLTADASGTPYIADTFNNRIRKVTAAGTITTVAGDGTAGFCGDGGPATSACLNGPEAVAVASDGTLYIADRLNHRIRKVTAAGTITTIAGNGTLGYCGDGGPATSACLARPTGVAVAAGGAVFVADYDNHRIRKVDAAGTITTIAGNGTAGFCGDAGPATSACLDSPVGVALGVDNAIFIADYYNHRIRKVDAAGIITTVAGNGSASFCGDGGPATSGCLWHPAGVAVDAGGGLLIADHLNHRVRRVGKPIASVTLARGLISGCLTTTGKVTLATPAPVGGTVVTLASSNVHAVVPASLTFNVGATVKSFSVVTSPVAGGETATITASAAGASAKATLVLKPMELASLTLAPNPVVGGNTSIGTVKLECAAGPGSVPVTLMSTKPTIAWLATPIVAVLQGSTTASFLATTRGVTVVTKPAIKATAGGVTKSKTLIVNPGS